MKQTNPTSTDRRGPPSRAEIDERQRWLASIVDSSPDMIIGETLDGVVTSWNAGAERVYGYAAEEAIGRRVADLIVPDDRRDELEHVLERLRRAEEIDWFETTRRTKDGRFVDISLHVSPVRARDGTVIGASAIACDITERRRVEHELARERSAAKLYLDVAAVMFVVIDADGQVELVNQKGCRILGYSESEIVGANWFERFVPERHRKEVRRVFAHLMRGLLRHEEYVENYVLTRTGEERLVAWHNAIIRDDDGTIIGTVSSGEDITDRRALEEAFRVHEMQFRRAIVESPVPVMLHADDGSIIEMSRAWTELTGYAPAEIPTIRDWTARAFGVRADEHRERIAKLYGMSERIDEGEITVRTATGAQRIWRFYSSPVGSDARGRRLVMTGATDLTERRLLEREILDISERERRRIGHDLHDGLASHLSGMAMLSRSLVHDMAAGRALRIEDIEEIAELARGGAEQARALAHGLSPVTLEPGGLVAALEDLARRTEHLSGIRCVFSGATSLPELSSDVVSQLFWIAREAVNNAVRHSGASIIRISTCHCTSSISVTVRDDGRGLDGVDEDSGLGIHIMRYRADVIGGSLSIAESPHGGLTVTCVLPTTEPGNAICTSDEEVVDHEPQYSDR